MEHIQRKIITIDAEGVPLGRLAVKVAVALRGKNKPNFVPYRDMGDIVVVKNTHHSVKRQPFFTLRMS